MDELAMTLTLPAPLVDLIAERAADLLIQRRSQGTDADHWMDTREAAVYLGLTPNALHKLTASRKVPFAQDARGGKCWFLRSEIDAWRRSGA